MLDYSVIYQRTHTGRVEIQEKKHGLTQSERLVLIMIDGISSYQEVRKKLPVLTDQRFDRAFQTLQAKELIVEVFLPLPGQAAELVERTVIDRFLQQDPLDPVTIIMYEPDELFGEAIAQEASSALTIGAAERRMNSASQVKSHLNEKTTSTAQGEPRAKATMDDTHIALVDSFGDELRTRQQFSRRSTDTGVSKDKQQRKEQRTDRQADETPPLTWPYWCVGIGIAFIAGFFVSKL